MQSNESTVVNRVSIAPYSNIQSASSYNAVLAKLAFFTLLMVLAPISTYFLSLEYVFNDKNTTGAAISAAVVANVVLIAFILVALAEDAQDQKQQKTE